MAKFYGAIGYGYSEETKPGVWENIVTERNYYGETLKTITKFTLNTDSTVDNVNPSDPTVSVISDPFALQHFSDIKYVTYMGVKWKVTSVEVQRPRLILSLGGIYHD